VEALDPAQLEEFAARACEALRIDPASGLEDFLEKVGPEHLRVRRGPGGALLAGAGFIPSAHRAGGRWVDAALVTVVWAAPAARGRGVASGLLREMQTELRAAGVPLATLAPANLRLYRGLGYGPAVARHLREAPLSALPARAPEGWTIEELAQGESGPLAQLYEAALPSLGPMAILRVPALWHALLRWNGGGRTSAVLARDPDGAVAGSCILDTRHADGTVRVRELVGLEPAAARTLVTHVAGYRGIFADAQWPGGPFDPFAAQLDEEPAAEHTHLYLVRLLDVRAAFEQRGYPPGLVAEIHLDVADDVLAANAGPLVLRLPGDGTATAEPGGRGTVAADVRVLASLFTGHATSGQLALAGGLAGPPAGLEALARAFAGPQPWFADRF